MKGPHNPLSQLNKYTDEICPYLGLVSDPETRFSNPNWENYCHRVEPAQSVSYAHQEEMCFTPKYSRCSVYQAEGKKSFPSEFKGEGLPLGGRGRFSWWWIGGLIIVAAVIFVAIRPGIFFAPSTALTPVGGDVPTSTPAMAGDASTPSNMQEEESTSSAPTISPTPTITSTPTKTPTPTITPTITPTPGPALGTPFGGDEQYVIYRVSEGDSMGELSRSYDTSPEVIRVSSALPIGRGIWPGDLLVIPIGQSDPDQVISFIPLYLERKTDIDELAARYEVFIRDIRLYNNLGDEEIIPGNRWLIIPARGE